MVVINWIKDKLDSGQKLIPRSFSNSRRPIQKYKQQIITEQRALAEHFRSCTEKFLDKLEGLTNKIATIDSASQQSVQNIKQKQQSLFFACLRLETSLKSNAELRRERKEWERRLPCNTSLDAYHPLARLELIDSELRIREQKLLISDPAPIDSPAKVVIDTKAVTNIPCDTPKTICNDEGVCIKHDSTGADELALPNDEYIVQRAEGLLMEISNHHNSTGDNSEYLDKTHELRDLHKVLNSLKRKNKSRNYRRRLRERMNQLFT